MHQPRPEFGFGRPLQLAVLVAGGSCVGVGEAAGPVDPPAGVGAMAPNLVEVDGGALLSWLEPVPAVDADGDRIRRRLRWSRFADGAWSPPRTIVERDDFFANWADIPSIVAGGDDALYAHWLQKSGPDTYAYDVVAARSADGGATWTTLGPVHDDGTQTEHGFVSMVPEAGGVRAFWLDGRAMASHDDGSMTVRSALLGTSVGKSDRLDERVCECCDTAAAVTDVGPLLVYRDRDAGEVRDVSIVRRVDGKWSTPRTVHDDGWAIAGCPVNGPAVAARGLDVIVVWFTGVSEQGRVQAAFSRDGGASFLPPVTIDEMWPLGRVDVVLLAPGEAIVCWLADRSGTGALLACRVGTDAAGPAVRTATTSLARSSGFPKVARTGDDLLVVWTEDGEDTRLRATTLPLGRFPPALKP